MNRLMMRTLCRGWIVGWIGVPMMLGMAAEAKDATSAKPVVDAVVGSEDRSHTPQSPGVQLAQRHLAELLPLLAHLRLHEPAQYDKAIRELDRAAKRLESQQRRGADFYDLALRQWQSRGRIDLLKAQLRVRPTPADRHRLLDEMRALRDIELARLRLEHEVLVQRQQMLTARLAQAEAASARNVEQIEALNLSIQRLMSQPIDNQWPAYRTAAGLDRESDSTKKSNKPNTSPESQRNVDENRR